MTRRTPRLATLPTVLLLGLAGCGGEESETEETCTVDSTYDPQIDPAQFKATVDNPFFPLVPGTTFIYSEGADTVTVSVLTETMSVLGVSCVVVHDVHTGPTGDVIEDTYDWYAEDQTGNVWYFGEATQEFSDAGTSTEGSWEAGVDGAKPGLVLPAAPTVGQSYRQEYYACEAEDMGEILAVDAAVMVPFGSYTGCIKTHDFTPLDPEVNEEKYYCSGVGFVLAVDVPTGGREELTDLQEP